MKVTRYLFQEYEDAQGGIDGFDTGEVEYEIPTEELITPITELIKKEYKLECKTERLEKLLKDLDIDFEDIAKSWYEYEIQDIADDIIEKYWR